MKEKLVNVETYDRTLQTKMMEEYDGILKGDNYLVNREDGRKLFIFMGLKKDKVDELIRKYKFRSFKITDFIGFPKIGEMGVSLN